MTGELMTCAKIYCIRGQHEQCQARSQDRLRWILQFQLMKPNSHRYPCMRGTIDGLHDGFVCLVPRINVTFHVLQRRTSDGARVEVAHQNAPAARMHAHTHTHKDKGLFELFSVLQVVLWDGTLAICNFVPASRATGQCRGPSQTWTPHTSDAGNVSDTARHLSGANY